MLVRQSIQSCTGGHHKEIGRHNTKTLETREEAVLRALTNLLHAQERKLLHIPILKLLAKC